MIRRALRRVSIYGTLAHLPRPFWTYVNNERRGSTFVDVDGFHFLAFGLLPSRRDGGCGDELVAVEINLRAEL